MYTVLDIPKSLQKNRALEQQNQNLYKMQTKLENEFMEDYSSACIKESFLKNHSESNIWITKFPSGTLAWHSHKSAKIECQWLPPS